MWLSALAFLAAAALVFGTGLSAAICAMYRKTTLARIGAAFAAASAVTYLIALFVSGAISSRTELSVGQEKHICEIDCHLAYSVVQGQQSTGAYSIRMRVRFDEATISARRDDRPLTPGPRNIVLIDADGLEYTPVRQSGLQTALRPGQSADAMLEFTLPANAKPVYLRFEDADPIKRLLIGSETAPLHKGVMFKLS